MHQKAAEHPRSSGLPRHQRLPQLFGQHPVPLEQTPAQHDRHDVPVRVTPAVARVGGGPEPAAAFDGHVHREYLLPQTLRGVVHDTHGHGVPFRRRRRHERRQVGNLGPLRRRSARVRPPSQRVRDVWSAGSEPKFPKDVAVQPRGRTPAVLHPRRRVERPGAEVVPAAPVLERGAPATRSSAEASSTRHPRRIVIPVVVGSAPVIRGHRHAQSARRRAIHIRVIHIRPAAPTTRKHRVHGTHARSKRAPPVALPNERRGGDPSDAE
mmetsp:Transcript_15097/g.63515  ORF Transcript_15097/g.63515 Transcript_15097/m.63515 type:complete len:267 (+) Transcript_15097:862-1662(+)